jgi:hypothetical protein
MKFFSLFETLFGAFVLSLAVSSSCLGSPVIFQRGLPSSLNTNDGANSSNIAWLNQCGGVAGVGTDVGGCNSGPGFINGDNFSLAPGLWNVDSISVWIVLNSAGDVPANEFSTFNLYGGLESNPSVFGLINSSAVATRAWYTPTNLGGSCNTVNGEDYLSSNGACLPIYEITFATNLTIAGGALYDFAADGTPIGGNGWFNLAANAPLAGTTQQGSDDLYLNWDASDFAAGPLDVNSDPSCGTPGHGPNPTPGGGVCGGWNKSSDISVSVTGSQLSQVPEPSTIFTFGVAFTAMIVPLRRRRASFEE